MRDDLQAALNDLQSQDRKAYKATIKSKHLAALERTVSSDEQIYWVQPATYLTDPNGEIIGTVIHYGLVALSDSRLFFVGDSGSAQWPYYEMAGVSDAKLRGVHRMRIAPRNGLPVWFALSDKNASASLLGTLESLIQDAASGVHATAGPATVQNTSTADEVAKLAQLHERGILSDEEFAAAKAKLLST